MTVEEIIDSALSLGDNVPSTDASYIERRRRAKAYLQEVFNDAYWARDWPRRNTQATLTVPAADNHVMVPVDFGSMGLYGGLYQVVGGVAQNPALDERPEHEIVDSRISGEITNNPGIFAIYDFDEVMAGDPPAGTGVFYDLIQLPNHSETLTFEIHYQRRPPALRDAGDPDETVGAELTAANLASNYIGEQYHGSVLVNGLKAKLRESKGDARWNFLQAQYQLAVMAMKKESNRFQSSSRQLPSFFGGTGGLGGREGRR